MVRTYSNFVCFTICLFGKICALKIAENEIAEVIVSMESGVEVVHEQLRARTYINREDRLNSVYDALTKHRDSSQQALLDYLISRKVKHDSLWISNQVYIPNCNADLLEQIKKFPGVSDVQRNEYFPLEEPIVEENEPSIQAEWGIEKIQAPQAWAAGWRGAGCTVGIIDTGARYTHIVIRDSYVGTANYGWRDPYSDTDQPTDGHGHGTHCTGTIVGGEEYGAGVAPGAQWMACKGCNDTGSCGTAQLLNCAQFMQCPTDSMGNNQICSRAPRIVSNSWAIWATGNEFDAAMQGWNSAGIVGVFALGNSGSSCSTSYYPGNSDQVIGVGATTSSDELASFSSKGPAEVTGIIKPDVSAPGQNIRSAYHTSDIAAATMSGTSMACPHVAGTLALMFGKNPNLTIDQARNILYLYADRDLPITGQTCGGVNEGTYKNNAHGWGRINAFKAAQAS